MGKSVGKPRLSAYHGEIGREATAVRRRGREATAMVGVIGLAYHGEIGREATAMVGSVSPRVSLPWGNR